MGEGAHGVPRPAGRAAVPPTAEGIERLQKRAFDEARKAGFEQGRSEGLKAAEAAWQERTQLAATLLQTLSSPLDELDGEVEESLVRLAVTIAGQLVRRALRTEPGHVVASVREAIKVMPVASRNVRLYLHPEDAALVRDSLRPEPGQGAWEIVEDPLLERGGCRVESEFSRVDASVESRMASVIAHVLGGERDDDGDAEPETQS